MVLEWMEKLGAKRQESFEEAQQLMKEEDWEKILSGFKRLADSGSPLEEIVGYVGSAQRVKPEGFSDLSLPGALQQTMKRKMEEELRGGNLAGFLEHANCFKEIKFSK